MAGVRRQAVRYVNRLRAERGLPKLHWDRQLSPAAKQHSIAMRDAGTIFHSTPEELQAGIDSSGEPWSLGGENVGMGSRDDLASLLEAFRHSKPHRRNMLRGKYDNIGVGVARNPDGGLFLTYWFYG